MNRRNCLKTLAAALATPALLAVPGCQEKSFGVTQTRAGTLAGFGVPGPFVAKVTLDTSRPGAVANALLCGTNTQWVDGGDGLLQRTGTEFVSAILEKVKQLSPTAMRYPGGGLSDVYNWRAGVGGLTDRQGNPHFQSGDLQTVRFGTAEFLALCEATGAVPMITVNICTGSPQDAADWVRATNLLGFTSPLTGQLLPKVQFWEIGNEPYLKEDDRPETWMTPDEFTLRANAFISAMRAVDPSILIGIPLRSDTFNNIPVTPYPGFNQQVLPQINQPFNYVSLHNAYMPVLYADVPSDSDIYASLMGASETVRMDLVATKTQIKQLIGHDMPLALTEYAALVTLGQSQDSYLASPAGAFYIADILRLLANQPNIIMANHWSLIGNWFFGALNSNGGQRPVFEVLSAYRKTLQGNYLPFTCQTKSFNAPAIGLMGSANNLPVVTGLATLNTGTLRLLLLNKDPNSSAQTTIDLGKRKFAAAVSTSTMSTTMPFANPDAPNAYAITANNLAGGNTTLALTLPPCSLTYLESKLV